MSALSSAPTNSMPSVEGSSYWTSFQVGALVVLLLILIVVVQYSSLVARYYDIYRTYGAIIDDPKKANIPVNIGPQRIMLGYEYPTLSATFLSRPIPQSAAEFLLRLVRTQQLPAAYLLVGIDNSLDNLKVVTNSEADWNAATNPLGPNGAGKIPWRSSLVQNYSLNTQVAGKARDLSLEVLWLYGYEEYVRQRFTSGATSVLNEWDFMFGAVADAPATPADSSCSAAAVGTDMATQALAMGSMGLMIGGPFAPIAGTGGAVLGALGAWFGKSKCRG